MLTIQNIGILFSACFVVISCSCTFPADLDGIWISSDKNTLTFTSNSITGYSLDKFGSVSLTCWDSTGSQYVAKSGTFSYYNVNFEAYICLELTQISSNKFSYYLGSVENAYANNERVKVEVLGTSVSLATICDRTSYATGSEFILLKNGTADSAKIECPSVMHGTWSYAYDSGSGSLCSTGSSVEVCSSPDLRTMTFDYTACSTAQAYSATGIVHCMYWTKDTSNNYYLLVYNTDTATDQSTTYSFTCYVISSSSRSLLATQYPKNCFSNQTSIYVPSPGATVVFSSKASCPSYQTDVVSIASAAGIAVGVVLLLIIILVGVLLWYYYKKRKEKKEFDKMPVIQQQQPGNKRLANVEIFSAGKEGSKMQTQNGDAKISIDTDPDIRRENSIIVSVASRAGSGMPGMRPATGSEGRNGPAPVEEPEKVNHPVIKEEDIAVVEKKDALASSFLPLSQSEKTRSDLQVKDIDINTEHYNVMRDTSNHHYDLDEIDDELGLPRLSKAFTPIIPPEPAPLPTIKYKRKIETESESEEERTAEGILKVKLKKKKKKSKKRVLSPKGKQKLVNLAGKTKHSMDEINRAETPFLERIKKQEKEREMEEERRKLEGSISAYTNGAGVPQDGAHARAKVTKKSPCDKADSKYVVDETRAPKFRPPDRRPLREASAERRRFGDPPAERKNRKRTPRLRHPMEIQADFEELQIQKEAQQKAPEAAQEDKRVRSGRRRPGTSEHSSIPPVQEDPFDHREGPPPSSAFSETRRPPTRPWTRPGNRPWTSGTGFERESIGFLDPPGDPVEDDVWKKASTMWPSKSQNILSNKYN